MIELSPLMLAAYRFDAVEVRQLLQSGHDPNERNPDGTPVLHIAIDAEADSFHQTGLSDRGLLPPSGSFVELFLQCGADANCTDENGRTALSVAVGLFENVPTHEYYHPRAVELLVHYGAKLPEG